MFLKIINKINYLIKLINLNFLHYFFLTKKNKIDRWHAFNNLSNRPYKKEIINFCNDQNFNNIMDYGCGFGDIVSQINAKKKFAYDNDPKIIKISDTLFKRKGINFVKSGELINIKRKPFSCILFINFLHDYSEMEIKKIINFFPNSNYILLDGINKGVKGFKYYHSYNFLKINYHLKKKKFDQEPDRTFFIFKKKNKCKIKKNIYLKKY